MTTLRDLARGWGMEEYAVLDMLDLGTDYDPTAELAPADEAWMREAHAAAEEAAPAE